MKKLFVFVIIFSIALSSYAQDKVYAPTLTLPANNAIHQMPDVFLNWQPVGGADHYKVQIDTNASFPTPSNHIATLTGMNASELSFSKKYYWRVKAYGEPNDSSDWSSVRNFSIIDTITLSTPANDAVNQMPGVQISWTNITGITHFDYEFDTTTLFNSSFLQQGSSVINNANGDQLYFGLHYYWRIRARHSLDTSSWSLVRGFTVLDTVTLSSPSNNAVRQMPNVLLTWENIVDINDYRIVIDTSLIYSPIAIIAYPDTNFINADTLYFGMNYLWKVRANHNNGNSQYSLIRYFRTLDSLNLLAPANNATNVSAAPLLRWSPVTGLRTIEVEYDTTASFTHPTKLNFPGTTSQHQFSTDLLVPKKYYWRARGLHQRDTTTWGITFNFTTGNTGIESNISTNQSFSIYPNPSDGHITIEAFANKTSDASLIIFDMTGKKITEKTITLQSGENKKELSVKLPDGLYSLRMEVDQKTYNSNILIKNDK